MKKRIVIINGKGGVGKDTLCDVIAKKYIVKNVSSITPIKEIAASAGYNDLTNFTRKFKSMEGVTPGEYRRNQKPPSLD